MKKLKQSELAAYREKLLKEQNYMCPLCNTYISSNQAVLDHDHSTGHCRAVLHRICNTAEGKMWRWLNRMPGDSPQSILNMVGAFWTNVYVLNKIHPKHKTSQEKEISRLRKRMKMLKTQKAKDRYKRKIEALKNGG